MTVLTGESGIGDLQRPLAAMELIVEFLVALEPAEVRQQAAPTPQLAACRYPPLVVVARVSAHIDLGVDTAAAAQHPAGGDLERPAVEVALRDGAMNGAVTAFRHDPAVAGRELQVRTTVLAPDLQQHDARAGVGNESPRGKAARATAADDHVITVLGRRHALAPQSCDSRRLRSPRSNTSGRNSSPRPGPCIGST